MSQQQQSLTRHRTYLRHRYRVIFAFTGFLWMIVAMVMLSSLLGLLFGPEAWTESWGIILPAFGLFVVGLAGWWQRPKEPHTLSTQEGAIIVFLAWLGAVLVGSVPFMLINQLTLTQAVFEATSGWTTTGLSVLDVTAVSPLILLYRSILQLAGGAGFAIIMLAAITGPIGTGITSAEGRGDQLVPHVRRSAAIVLRMYIAYNIVGIIALWLAGMSLFDAINHAFAALSTGGFSTRAESIGYWDSPLVEAVIIILMLLGTTNFLVAYALTKGQWQALFRTTEMRLLLVLLLFAVPLLFFSTAVPLYVTADKALRVAIFEAVSAISTCGFATVSYAPWPSAGWFILILLMMIGGGTGSTAGGIKLFRVGVLYRSLRWQIKRALQPASTVSEPHVLQAGDYLFLSDGQIRQIGLYAALHLMTIFAGSLLITLHGYDLASALFEMTSSVSTIGLSVGITSVNAPTAVLWTQTLGMFFGRLEFFPIIVGGIKIAQDLRRYVS
jgi:trk system potassium uptake protein